MVVLRVGVAYGRGVRISRSASGHCAWREEWVHGDGCVRNGRCRWCCVEEGGGGESGGVGGVSDFLGKGGRRW